jgi:hypothetical protein
MGDEAAPSVDNFDAIVGSQDFGDDGGGAEPQGDEALQQPTDAGGGGRQSLGSVIHGDDPAPGIDPVTGRAMDGPGELPTEQGEEGEPGEPAPAEAAPEPDELDPDLEAEPAEEAPAEEIYGLKQEDLLAALKEGKLPDELLEHLTVTQKHGDEEIPTTIQELRENGMRQLDYSRKSRELADARKQFQAAEQDFIGMADVWKTDEPKARAQTRRELEKLGVPLVSIAEDMIKEADWLATLTPEQQQAYEWQQQERRKLEAEKLELAMKQQQGQQTDADRRRQAIQDSIGKLRPAAFKAIKLPETKASVRMFADHLGASWDRKGPITQKLVSDAAKATQQELKELGMQHETTGQAPQQPAQRPAPAQQQRRGLSPRPQSRGAAGPASGRQRAPGKFKATPDNFDDWLAKQR